MGEDWDREINLVQSTIKRLPLVDKKKKCPHPILSVSPLSSLKPAINKLCKSSFFIWDFSVTINDFIIYKNRNAFKSIQGNNDN